MAPIQKSPEKIAMESSNEELSPAHKSQPGCATPNYSVQSLPRSSSRTHIGQSDSSGSSRLSLNSDHSNDATCSTSQECEPSEVTYVPTAPSSANVRLSPEVCDEKSICDDTEQDGCDVRVPLKSKWVDGHGPDSFAGNVPFIVCREERRRRNSKAFNRKLTKYLLFRSDQHLLYRSCIFIFGSIISAVLFYILWFTDIYWIAIRRINVLEPDNSISFRNFHKIPVVDNTLCVTLFNITNLDEFHGSGHQMALDIQPVGPFCFWEELEKIHIKFNENRTKVSYRENSTFHYLPERSNGSMDDIVSVISFPFLTITSRVAAMNLAFKLAMSTKINSGQYSPFVTLSVRDFLYGYDDELLTWTFDVGTSFGFDIPYRRFSMLQTLQDQINNNFTVDTGRLNIDTLQRVSRYNGRAEISSWRGEPCTGYDGTDGTFYESARIARRDSVSFFSNFLCRNVKLEPFKEMELFKVTTVPRYTMVPDMLHYNKTDDDCYCLDPPCIDNLFYTGDCFPGPIVFSYKYFHGVDAQHLAHLSPLPAPGDWRTYFDVFPALGSAVSSTQRIQLNMMVRKSRFFNHPSYFEHQTVLPGVYLERTFPGLTFEAYWYLFHATFTLPTMEYVLKFSLIPVNLFFIYYWSSVLFLLCKCVVLAIKTRLSSR